MRSAGFFCPNVSSIVRQVGDGNRGPPHQTGNNPTTATPPTGTAVLDVSNAIYLGGRTSGAIHYTGGPSQGSGSSAGTFGGSLISSVVNAASGGASAASGRSMNGGACAIPGGPRPTPPRSSVHGSPTKASSAPIQPNAGTSPPPFAPPSRSILDGPRPHASSRNSGSSGDTMPVSTPPPRSRATSGSSGDSSPLSTPPSVQPSRSARRAFAFLREPSRLMGHNTGEVRRASGASHAGGGGGGASHAERGSTSHGANPVSFSASGDAAPSVPAATSSAERPFSSSSSALGPGAALSAGANAGGALTGHGHSFTLGAIPTGESHRPRPPPSIAAPPFPNWSSQRPLLPPPSLSGPISAPDRDGTHDFTLECGLFQDQVIELMYRDLTPEDFENLCKLDDKVPKRNTAKRTVVDSLPKVLGKELKSDSGDCSICLGKIGAEQIARQLPCKHAFHHDCISKWLTTCESSCPLCKASISSGIAESTIVL